MLIDSNIFIEIARKQKEYRTCLDLINVINSESLGEDAYITKFSLHAIEAILGKKDLEFVKKILLLIHQDKIKVYDFDIGDHIMIASAIDTLGLDFDDATQYVAANKLFTYLVTLDKDFKKTGIRTKTPKQVLFQT